MTKIQPYKEITGFKEVRGGQGEPMGHSVTPRRLSRKETLHFASPRLVPPCDFPDAEPPPPAMIPGETLTIAEWEEAVAKNRLADGLGIKRRLRGTRRAGGSRRP